MPNRFGLLVHHHQSQQTKSPNQGSAAERLLMSWDQKGKRDHNIMFAVHYEDGRTAYITISPKDLLAGEHLARCVARERQERGEIPGARFQA